MSEKIQCPKCNRTLKLRKDGALPKHKLIRRGVRGPMERCSWGGGWLEWLSDGSAQVHRTPPATKGEYGISRRLH